MRTWLIALGLLWVGSAQAAMKVEHDAEAVRVLSGERVVMEYRYAKVPAKPYVSRLATPKGVEVLRDAPADHLHHHGLMFAIKVDGVNFWEEVAGAGKQETVDRQMAHMTPGKAADLGGVCSAVAWKAPDGAANVREGYRQVWVQEAGGATLLTWRTNLRVPKEATAPVKLGGNHYHGLGMRFPEWMDQAGTFIHSDADAAKPDTVRGTEQLTKGAWCAYHVKGPEHEVTVAMFSHPENPRPALFFTMSKPFSYLSATHNWWKEPMEVKPGEGVRLVYGVAAWDGKVDRETIAKMYEAWKPVALAPADIKPPEK